MLNELNLLGLRKKVIVAHFDKAQIAVMEAIDEKTEKNLDKLCSWSNGKEIIDKNKVFLYGEVNINNDEDRKVIKRVFPMSDGIAANQMRSGFDYESGIVSLVDNEFRWHPTVDHIKWFKYNHCLLGKPKRVIVYKTSLSML